jgi:cytochrome bd-type quinol oxidase subunit 2
MAILIALMAPFVLASWFFAWWLFDHGAQSPQSPAAALRMRSDRWR